jgi:ribonuclease P protein component
MIGITHRFHGYGSLNGVYKRGQSVRGSMISLRYMQRDQRRPYRAAVVVSRKVSKSAVVRNRIRRRIYEVIRQADGSKLVGTDLVFTVFDERVAGLPPAELQAAIYGLLQKAAVRLTAA